jgi:hypothetical protein
MRRNRSNFPKAGRGRKKNHPRGTARARKDRASLAIMHSVSKVNHLITASEMDTMVTFVQTYSLVSATQSAYSYPLLTNAAYDVDPSLGSTATQGFAEWAAFFNYYRVYGYRGRIEFVSTSIQPVTVVVGHTNTNATVPSGGGSVDLVPASGNPEFTSRLLGHAYSGNNRWISRFNKTISSIVGSVAPETEDNFRALVTAIPTDLTYVVFGATTIVPPLSQSVDVLVHIEFAVRFYDRKLLIA